MAGAAHAGGGVMSAKEYLCSYQYEGERWSFSVMAETHEEARRRVRAIGLTGAVDGEIVTARERLAGLFPWVKKEAP